MTREPYRGRKIGADLLLHRPLAHCWIAASQQLEPHADCPLLQVGGMAYPGDIAARKTGMPGRREMKRGVFHCIDGGLDPIVPGVHPGGGLLPRIGGCCSPFLFITLPCCFDCARIAE